ncbi:hypothetical protein B5X24_HaOG214223 [Helicoverpa armigera]|nr:hypothetical protein B5X24_HaOG214223 [Helicoverpa armigera]
MLPLYFPSSLLEAYSDQSWRKKSKLSPSRIAKTLIFTIFTITINTVSNGFSNKSRQDFKRLADRQRLNENYARAHKTHSKWSATRVLSRNSHREARAKRSLVRAFNRFLGLLNQHHNV